MAVRARIRRIARVTGIAAGTVLGIVVLLCLLLLVRPVRENVLGQVVEIASDRLPGTIEFESAAWPTLSRFELRSVRWQQDGVLFAKADRIALDADLGALLNKDLHVRSVVVEGAEADIPAIVEAVGPDPEDREPDSGQPSFPREGALPGIPSIAVDSLAVELIRLVAAPEVTVQARVSLAADLGSGHAPTLALHSLEGSWIEPGWTVNSPGLELAVDSGEFRGSIEADLQPRGAVVLAFESPAAQRFRILLSERGSAEALLQVDGSYTRTERGVLETVDYAFSLHAPGLERIESALQRPGSLASLVPLGQVDARGEGRLSLAEPVSGEFAISIEADAAAMQVEAEGRHQPDRIEIERLDVGADGLAIVASGTYSSGAWTGNLEADVSGTRFLAAWPGTDAIPEDLRAHLELEAGGEGTAVRPALLLAGAAPSTGLDSLHVVGYGRIDGPETDLRVDIRALVRDQFAIALDARALDLERPRLHVAPIVVRQRLDELADSPAPIPDGANVVIAPQERSVVIDGLRVTGGLGELRLDGKYTEPEGGDGRLVIEWPEPPTVLELAGFDAAERDTLLAPGWSQDGVPGIDARVRFGEGARSGSLDADIALPAPWSLVAGLQPAAYGATHLRGIANGAWEEPGSWTAMLDFAATAWLDSAFAHVHGTRASASLDSMLIRGGPVRATAAAQLDSAEVDGKFQLDLVSHPALAMVVPDLPSDLQFLVNLRAGVAGSPQAPDARAKLLVSARSPRLSLPFASVEAEIVEGVPQSAQLEINERATVGGFAVRRARVAIHPEEPESGFFPLRFAGELQGDAEWAQVARVDSIGNTWRIETDSLRIGAGGHVLDTVHSFTLEVAPADGTILLDGLELAGKPGTLSASLDLGPDRALADVELHLDASIPGALVRMPPRMLPTGYHLVAKGNQDDLEASLRVEGLTLGARTGIVAEIDSRRAGDQVEIEIRAGDQAGRIARGDVVLPLTTDLLNRRFAWHDEELSGTVEIDSLPLPYRIGGNDGLGSYLLGSRDESAPIANARLLLAGTGLQPVVGARVSVGFPQIEKLREDRLRLEAVWIGRHGNAAALGLFDQDALERMRQALPHGGVAVLGSLDRGTQSLASLRAGFPLTADATSPFPGFGPEDPVIFAITADPLRLGEWQPLLPRGSEIGGILRLNARGEGPIGDFPLDAAVRMEKVSFRQGFGNSATLNGQIDVSGRSSAPVIRGKITVPNALVRLPESGRNLHAVTGESQLWKLGLLPRDEFAVLDSLEVEWGWRFTPEDSTQVEQPLITLAESTDLDVTIEIPNSFWIRGQGLNVQLAGNLRLVLLDGVPTAVGELRALSGTLEVVGARLQLDRGVVSFYGGDTTNPALDLELSREQGDVRVIVRVTGTALEPRLAFDSDPPMSQSDIMSYLLFGSSASDLDGAQTQLLQDQAAAALSQFAAPMLENELTQSLGISMMQLQAGEDPDDGLSLVVGKYVTPQILIKYEQSLKDRQKYTVNSEYWLSRNLRIETRLSETRSTGIELNWSTDY